MNLVQFKSDDKNWIPIKERCRNLTIFQLNQLEFDQFLIEITVLIFFHTIQISDTCTYVCTYLVRMCLKSELFAMIFQTSMCNVWFRTLGLISDNYFFIKTFCIQNPNVQKRESAKIKTSSCPIPRPKVAWVIVQNPK